MGTELVPIADMGVVGQSSRLAALESLNVDAANAQSPQEAHVLMEQSRVIAEALARMRAPSEETRLASKASVLAARRLGRMLSELPNTPRGRPGRTTRPSLMGEVAQQLGLSTGRRNQLVRLARVPDPDFQRYIQQPDIVTIGGALVHFSLVNHGTTRRQWTAKRKLRAGVKTASNPSLDAAHALIIQALGHLDGVRIGGTKAQKTAVSVAMSSLYDAEDSLRPFLGGYVK